MHAAELCSALPVAKAMAAPQRLLLVGHACSGFTALHQWHLHPAAQTHQLIVAAPQHAAFAAKRPQDRDCLIACQAPLRAHERMGQVPTVMITTHAI